MALRGSLLKDISDNVIKTTRKVTIVGAGNVGMAIVMCLLGKGISKNICLVDKRENIVKGEVKDLQHGAALLNNAKLLASTDYACTANSDICIITAGAVQKKGENRYHLLKENVAITQEVVQKLIKYNRRTTLILANNPVDVCTYVAWKESRLPINRVIGSGTYLDSNRFRSFIAERLCVSPASVYGNVIGEHGDSSVPCWSGVTVGHAHIASLYPEIGKKNDPDKWYKVHRKVQKAAYDVRSLKGATWWAIGLSVANIVSCILDNKFDVIPVTTNAQGFYGIEDEVFLSLPCVLGLNGIQGVVNQKLSCEEKRLLHISSKILWSSQRRTGIS